MEEGGIGIGFLLLVGFLGYHTIRYMNKRAGKSEGAAFAEVDRDPFGTMVIGFVVLIMVVLPILLLVLGLPGGIFDWSRGG